MPLDRLADRHLGRDQRQDLQVCHEGDVVEREHIGRIRHRQGQHVAHPLDRRTACFLAICAGTRFRASGSISSCETAIEGTPYWRERDPSSCSSATRFRRRSTDPSLSLVPFCAAIARARPSWAINPCATRTSPRRRLTGWPSVLTAVDAVLGAAVIVMTAFARGPAAVETR